MSEPGMMTFGKAEKLCSRTLIERLFNGGGGRSMAAFPLRLVYMRTGGEGPGAPVQMLVSVPKRCFKRAVRRNRVKRQVREAYRKNRHILSDAMQSDGCAGMALAFIWLDDRLWDTAMVEHKVANLMQRLAEKVAK